MPIYAAVFEGYAILFLVFSGATGGLTLFSAEPLRRQLKILQAIIVESKNPEDRETLIRAGTYRNYLRSLLAWYGFLAWTIMNVLLAAGLRAFATWVALQDESRVGLGTTTTLYSIIGIVGLLVTALMVSSIRLVLMTRKISDFTSEHSKDH